MDLASYCERHTCGGFQDQNICISRLKYMYTDKRHKVNGKGKIKRMLTVFSPGRSLCGIPARKSEIKVHKKARRCTR